MAEDIAIFQTWADASFTPIIHSNSRIGLVIDGPKESRIKKEPQGITRTEARRQDTGGPFGLDWKQEVRRVKDRYVLDPEGDLVEMSIALFLDRCVLSFELPTRIWA